MSKYDAPWRTALGDEMWSEGTFRAGTFRGNLVDSLRKAFGGRSSTIDVPPEIRDLGGARGGKILVRSDGVIPTKSTPMVHVKSLGQQVVNRGMLAEWPDSVFRFSMNGTGARLTVCLEPPDASRPRSAQAHETHSVPAVAPPRSQEELPPGQSVALSDVIRTCIGKVLSVNLDSEWTAGPSNRVDFSGVSSKLGRIRVERETRREDPVNNVAKAWRQAHEKTGESFTLIHVFSGYYSKGSRRAKRDNAQFVGDRMNEWARDSGREIRYKAVSFDFDPPSGDLDPHLSSTDAKQICDQIRGQLLAGGNA